VSQVLEARKCALNHNEASGKRTEVAGFRWSLL